MPLNTKILLLISLLRKPFGAKETHPYYQQECGKTITKDYSEQCMYRDRSSTPVNSKWCLKNIAEPMNDHWREKTAGLNVKVPVKQTE